MIRHALPPIVEGVRCVPIFIPDNEEYAQLLIFAVRKICQQKYYERDDANTAKLVADTLKDVTLQPLITALLENDNCAMIDCEQVEDCLETSNIVGALEDEAQVSRNFYKQYTINIDATIDSNLNTAEKNQITTPFQALPAPSGGYDCNYDALWAGVYSVVEYLDRITVDLLEQLTAANDQNERYASMVEAIPFLAELPLDEALEYTAYVSQELENSYNGAVTLEFKQSVACDLFCALAQDCDSLSNSNLLDYLFNTRLGIVTSYAELTATMSASILFGLPMDNIWVGTDMALGMWATTLWLCAQRANFYGGFGDKNVNIAFRTGLNSPDNDWSILCEACFETYWTYEWDFSAGDGGWTKRNGIDGIYSGGAWRTVNFGVNSYMTIDVALPSEVAIRGIEVDYQVDTTDSLAYHGCYLVDDPAVIERHVLNLPNAVTTPQTASELAPSTDGWTPVDRLTIALHRTANGGASDIARVTAVRISGYGVYPF